MNNLTNSRSIMSPSSAPEADPGAAQTLALATNLLFRDYPAMPELLSEPLSTAARSRLEVRLAHIDYKMTPAGDNDVRVIAAAIAGVLGAFPAAAAGSAENTIAKYTQVMRGLPLWAVLKACSDVEFGRAEGASLDYRPSAPRLRQIALQVMHPWLEEKHNIHRVLSAPTLEPDDAKMRERLRVVFTQFAADLKMGKYKYGDAPNPSTGTQETGT